MSSLLPFSGLRISARFILFDCIYLYYTGKTRLSIDELLNECQVADQIPAENGGEERKAGNLKFRPFIRSRGFCI